MARSVPSENANNADNKSNDNSELAPDFPETDVTLVFEDRKIHVNKAVLSQHSPVFKAMFSGSFKESTSSEIPLVDKKYKDVVEFLRCFYPNKERSITEQNVLQILPLAHEYQSPLITDCEKLLIDLCKPGTGLLLTSLLDYVIAAEKCDLDTLLDAAVEFCSHIGFDLLSGEMIRRESRSKNKPNKLMVLDSPRKWIFSTNKNLSSKFSQIGLKTRYTIAVKRLQVLEMNKCKADEGEQIEDDFDIGYFI
ncbi:uncharacterized protein LOC134236698 [Saccostrea cucullata]|uniref:uncharacterized protein LOC134236698 n=1 Tax=Saccostrea cuccullata TaxID=36930 RepID=UPI002ED55570